MFGHLQDFLLDGPARIRVVSEDITRKLPNTASFEERVFARFDAMGAGFEAVEARFDAMEARFEGRFIAIDARLDKINGRFDGIDNRLNGIDNRVKALEARALDTKPIWERALAEIVQVKIGVENLNRKIDVLNQDLLQVRADQRRIEQRMDNPESKLQ